MTVNQFVESTKRDMYIYRVAAYGVSFVDGVSILNLSERDLKLTLNRLKRGEVIEN